MEIEVRIKGRKSICELQPGRHVIGNRTSCGLVVDAPGVGAQHAMLLLSTPDGGDLRSLGGAVRHDGRNVTRVTVSPGTTVAIGEAVLVFGKSSPNDSNQPAAPKELAPVTRNDSESLQAVRKTRHDRPVKAHLPARTKGLGGIWSGLDPHGIAALLSARDVTMPLLEERLARVRVIQGNEDAHREEVRRVIAGLVRDQKLPSGVQSSSLASLLEDEVLGLGVMEALLVDEDVTEIMVNHDKVTKQNRIYVERGSGIELTPLRYRSSDQLRTVIERIVSPLNKRIDDSSPRVDARLEDGSRVNAIIPPLAVDGPSITIRKFRKAFGVDALQAKGALSAQIVEFLRMCVECRLNIIVSGGTGSGKTTLLNALASFIPENERIVTIEDTAELQLPQEHVVRLESRPPTIEGSGEVTIRDLVINALRMRPDRIVIGECRGGEALDMMQAMNTGHDGSLTTLHANSPRDALRRLEVLCLMAKNAPPHDAIREQIVSAVHLVVQIQRFSRDNSRKVVKISEVNGMQGNMPSMSDIFEFRQTGFGEANRILGTHGPTGVVPGFVEEWREAGIEVDMEMFNPKGGHK
jgi:pilus assembly protein CpaF